MPPTLILTGEYATLGPEMDRLAEQLVAAVIGLVHHDEFSVWDRAGLVVPAHRSGLVGQGELLPER